MKAIKFYITMMALIDVLYGCKTTDTLSPQQGIINVVNAVIGGGTLTMNTNNSVISGNNTINNNNYISMPIAVGQTQVNLYVPAIAATGTSPAIAAVTYYNQTVPVTSNGDYSLFLTGISPTAVDNVLITENYPYAYQDSVCAVRFINLSPGSNPISVDVKGSANGSEVASLAYKAYSGFIQYPAKKLNPSYIFEFRDASNGTLLTSYTMITPYFHNVTLCLRGKAGAYGVILDNDY